MVKYLIDRGLDVNHKNNLKRNVFIYSIDLKNNETFNYLIDQNPSIVNSLTVECPLILAALNGKKKIFLI